METAIKCFLIGNYNFAEPKFLVSWVDSCHGINDILAVFSMPRLCFSINVDELGGRYFS